MKIIGIGRNYSDHAKELGNAVPEEPIIFFKPDTALLKQNGDFFYPEFSKDIHFECELVFRISREGKYVKSKFAHTYIDGIGLGIDFTARDLQSEAKKKGLPWTLAKGFNQSAPISEFKNPADFPDWKDIRFEFKVNGETRQIGHSADMIFDVPYLVEYISQFITLKKGDMIYTGTPQGVGPVKQGDHLQGWMEGEKMLDFFVR